MEKTLNDLYLDVALAAKVSCKQHAGQKYGKRDYFLSHVNSVEQITFKAVMTDGSHEKKSGEEWEAYSSRCRIVAYLHDVIEDTDMTLEELSSLGFDYTVVDAVKLLTKVPPIDIDLYLRDISKNDIAYIVKRSDLMANTMQCIHDDNESRFKYYSNQLSKLMKFRKVL